MYAIKPAIASVKPPATPPPTAATGNEDSGPVRFGDVGLLGFGVGDINAVAAKVGFNVGDADKEGRSVDVGMRVGSVEGATVTVG